MYFKRKSGHAMMQNF